MELAFQNNRTFMQENRERYETYVRTPMRQLNAILSPVVKEIDDRLDTNPSRVISRINRDTRYTIDKSPYRDHMWLGYRMPDSMVSENFVIYAEFERESYGYGMGMYAPNAPMMQKIRANILARPQTFLSLIREKSFADMFALEGVMYQRPKFTDVPKELLPYVNRKSMSFCFSSPALKRTVTPEIADEIIAAFRVMKPVYRFLMGLA